MKTFSSVKPKYHIPEDNVSPLSTPTKRRKRDHNHNAAKIQSTESFIMKLFDRSLDLSKYNEKTPLYPICRAWIANQPRNPNLISVPDQPEPLPRRENNGAELLTKIQRGERIPNITSLPAPLNIEVLATPEIERKPNLEALDEYLKRSSSEDDNMEDERIKMLTEYKEKWRKNRSLRKQTTCYDKRYALNQLILAKLFRSG